jgi:hypothetical protein
MRFNLVTFLRQLIIFTLIIGAAGFGIVQFIPAQYITPTLPYLYVFFFSVTILVHYTLLLVSKKRTLQFSNYFMLLTFGKLIFFLSIILVYFLLNRDDVLPFAIAFFILYILFTVFEVMQSLALSKSGTGKQQKED